MVSCVNRKSIIFLSSNGYQYLESYLTELYGKRGRYSHNLERYACSEEFRSVCHYAETVEDFSEVNFEMIKHTIAREEHFQRVCRELIEHYDQLLSNNKLRFEDALEVAGVLGLAGGATSWSETLLPHVCDLFFSAEELENELGLKLEQRLREKSNLVMVMVNTMLDGMRRGQIIQSSDGRDVFSLGYARNLWRGENRFYGSSKAALFRNRPIDKEEGELHDLIGMMKVIEFSYWLKSLDFVRTWPYGDPFHGAIAQHYGIPTNAIDVSSDLKTALFFACTKYEPATGQFRKLLPDEYSEKDSRTKSADSNADSRYGILFKAPYDVINMSIASADPRLHFTSALPIGFQPFLRCSNQSGYLIETGKDFDLYKDGCFGKFKFRLCPEIIDWIFEKMNGGVDLYPRESFGSVEEIVKEINTSSVFTEKAFEGTIEYMNFAERKDQLRNLLLSRGYSLVEEKEWCPSEKQRQIQADFWTNISEFEDKLPPPKFRFGFCI